MQDGRLVKIVPEKIPSPMAFYLKIDARFVESPPLRRLAGEQFGVNARPTHCQKYPIPLIRLAGLARRLRYARKPECLRPDRQRRLIVTISVGWVSDVDGAEPAPASTDYGAVCRW